MQTELQEAIRAEVARRTRRYRINQYACYVVILVVVVFGFYRINGETHSRIDQTCTLFETSHLADVQQLRSTYRYLLALRPNERSTTINRFVLAGLPAQEKKARIDTAPDFCDEPGLGLPEPDPVVPKRPPTLKPGPS